MSQVTCDQLFGTPIWHIESELPEGAVDWALSIEKNVENQNGKRSGRLGYQSPRLSTMHTARGALQYPMTNWDEFPYFEHIKKQLDFLPQFKFNNYWVNVNRKNSYNVKHTHPCVDLSVVWYLTDSMGLMVIEHPMVHTRTHLYEKIGHEVRVVDYLRCYMNITSKKPTVIFRGEKLENYDAVISRIGASYTFLAK